jgi:hypothetical protein
MFELRKRQIQSPIDCPPELEPTVLTSTSTTSSTTLLTRVRTTPIATTTLDTPAPIDRFTTVPPSFTEASVVAPTTTMFRATPRVTGTAATTKKAASANGIGEDANNSNVDVDDNAPAETDWALIGGAVGGAVALLAICAAAFFLAKRRRSAAPQQPQNRNAVALAPQHRPPAALPPGSVAIGHYDSVNVGVGGAQQVEMSSARDASVRVESPLNRPAAARPPGAVSHGTYLSLSAEISATPEALKLRPAAPLPDTASDTESTQTATIGTYVASSNPTTYNSLSLEA